MEKIEFDELLEKSSFTWGKVKSLVSGKGVVATSHAMVKINLAIVTFLVIVVFLAEKEGMLVMERVKSMIHKWMTISNINIHFYKALLVSSLIELEHFYGNFENYKSVEIDLSIYCKPRIWFSWFLERKCIILWWTTLVSSIPI